MSPRCVFSALEKYARERGEARGGKKCQKFRLAASLSTTTAAICDVSDGRFESKALLLLLLLLLLLQENKVISVVVIHLEGKKKVLERK